MKHWRIVACILFLATLWPCKAAADGAIGPPPLPSTTMASPVIITAVRFSGTSATGGAPVFVQLYNNSDDLVDIHDWRLTISTPSQEIILNMFSTWLQPRGYIVAGDSTVADADYTFTLSAPDTEQLATASARTISLEPTTVSILAHSIPTPFYVYGNGQWLQRMQTSSGKYNLTGKTTDFAAQNGTAQLYSGGAYTPASNTDGLTVVELLPNAQGCPPTSTDLRCNDYIKLYNAGDHPVDLAGYRVRSSYGGTKSSTSNTFMLSGSLEPDAYYAVSLKDDGTPLSLVDSGGYVWLEDAYGLKMYEHIIAYPSAGSDAKAGWAWAFDGTTWRWTADPQPNGSNNFPPETPQTATDETTLSPCGPGQERNPDTNRCRSIINAATVLVSCGPGEERNPQTNRCRSVPAASTSLQPCPAGQARNPETNRCRKDQNADIPSIKDIAAATAPTVKMPVQWFVAIGVATLALGYGIYEWRQDIQALRRTLKPRLAAFASQHLHIPGRRKRR